MGRDEQRRTAQGDGEEGMNKPSVSLDTLEELVEIESDKAVEIILRRHGFTDTDFVYKEICGKRHLYMNKKVIDYARDHKETLKKEIQDAIDEGFIKAMETGLEIIRLQKLGGRV
jgi:hypothetical protein